MAQVTRAHRVMKEAVRNANVVDARGETDTIRLWENYRDQALLWRSLCILQIPTTLVALIFSLILWNGRHITLKVPREPLPGSYSASEIPDEKFMEAATEFINLIATYTPANARSQFRKAREMLKEPLLSKFDVEMIGTELKAIENTGRTQVFFIDPSTFRVDRASSTEIVISVGGNRLKLVSGKELPEIMTTFNITLTTVPRNVLNPYGIVVTNVETVSETKFKEELEKR